MRILRLKEGSHYSPLKEIPRNAQCVCGSGKKWKNCHWRKMEITREIWIHREILAAWKAGQDTTKFFITKEAVPE